MLIVSLLLFGYKSISNFYNAQDELQEIQDVAKFNAQFTGYVRDNVRGYELISLANKIADYNERYSIAEGAKNDKNFAPITLVIDFENEAGQDKRSDLCYKDKDNKLFTAYTYQNIIPGDNKVNAKYDLIAVLNEAGGIEISFGTTPADAAKIARNLSTLIWDNFIENEIGKLSGINDFDDLSTTQKTTMENMYVQNYKTITGKTDNITFDDVKNNVLNDEKVYKYYEFYQFKKAKFECTNIEYDDNVSGRVSKLEFKFKNL